MIGQGLLHKGHNSVHSNRISEYAVDYIFLSPLICVSEPIPIFNLLQVMYPYFTLLLQLQDRIGSTFPSSIFSAIMGL